MTAFALEVLLLMVVAYFLGTTLACLIRRGLHRGIAPAERRVDPLPEYASLAAEKAFARVAETAEPRPRPVPAPPPAPAPVVVAAPAPPAPSGPQDLKRIRLIDAAIESKLRELGVARYEQIAAWTRADLQRVAAALGIGARISRENWIEQAQVLAKGGETHYAARRARGETATSRPTSDEGERGAAGAAASEPLPRPMSAAGVAAAVIAPTEPPAAEARPQPAPPPAPAPEKEPMVSERAAFANGAGAQPAPAVRMVPAVAPARDNLQRIGGISAEIEQELHAHGVTRYAQIAQWGAADVEKFDALLDTAGRIARENWIEQAHILSRGGDTRFSREFDGRPAFRPTKLADAIRENKETSSDRPPAVRTDLGSLRSVRSQAYRNMPEPGPEAAQRAASRTPASAGGTDDLKRIRGIGVLIEKRLNALGVTSYDHIANWTAADIDRISQSLDFKGRIERENWVEQARILSAGGHTEFSRRVDRGEVESSRPKA